MIEFLDRLASWKARNQYSFLHSPSPCLRTLASPLFSFPLLFLFCFPFLLSLLYPIANSFISGALLRFYLFFFFLGEEDATVLRLLPLFPRVTFKSPFLDLRVRPILPFCDNRRTGPLLNVTVPNYAASSKKIPLLLDLGRKYFRFLYVWFVILLLLLLVEAPPYVRACVFHRPFEVCFSKLLASLK